MSKLYTVIQYEGNFVGRNDDEDFPRRKSSPIKFSPFIILGRHLEVVYNTSSKDKALEIVLKKIFKGKIISS